MGDLESPFPPHLYPQAIQLKLYQAFIFSIPILFSIILFLLFYLFYLKRRASSSSSLSPVILPLNSAHQSSFFVPSVCVLDVKVELKDKLPVVLFNEELRTRDTLCCVCLGEFEMKEELVQVPSCKHMFHLECICLWLHSHSTCPLCRSSITPKPSSLPQSTTNNDDSHSLGTDSDPTLPV